jgi:4-hydroxythreonine-4-phosphate dehydrogenase
MQSTMTGVFTCGDINGVGPEISLKAIDKLLHTKKIKIKLVMPANVFEEVSKLTWLHPDRSENFELIDIGNYDLTPGGPSKTSGNASFEALKTGFALVESDKNSFLVTAPISKYAFNLAGVNFPGHTEMLAEWSGSDNFVMMFLSDNFKCALATIHIPISKVPEALSKATITQCVETVRSSLNRDFCVSTPSIALLGLNPHAGENGLIGNEEIDRINGVVESFGGVVKGPFPADAFFGRKQHLNFDIFIALYHDQGLIPFKLLTSGSGVNYTAGLGIVRTSPDHGTAYDIAWQNKADASSMIKAVEWGRRICSNRWLFDAR